ncbi:MAG: carboxyl transferase domain-containing protein [Myxococcales bacterium]|jgi:acetyl/propionyl-CoA carboxylase alpha subunit/acetyl-CoA carboxylase carboxyltransferase component
MTDTSGQFERIAIVNRGEPALRLMRAVRDWNAERGAGLKTIALFTEPDRDALFVREADSAFNLGPAMFLDERDRDGAGQPRRKSRYLDYDRLREALVRTRADAAWVGWGFVAEHAAFAEMCRELGVTFIGPTPEAMRRLGDKVGSKLLAEQAGAPVAPWSGGPVATLEEARAHAARIGYPLLVKATAGGGGRGIRFVTAEDQLEAAFASASSEARKAFGDGTVFLEACVQAARHVEVQVVADAHGTVWAAGVRDCSVQRNNQKVIEEAPSPALSADQMAALREASVRIAKAAGYLNAGTVEFLLGPDGRFYFMEMNTRLQVEHPVTEATTGLDLVRLQLAIAAGERLQGEPPPTRGYAIEVRLCAEDPERNFAPAPGRIVCFRPALGPGVRTDSGVREGDEIPVEFDSMIAKIIAHGDTREEARARLARALLETLVVVEGGTTNRAFLLRLLRHPDFVAGRFDTGWLDRLMQSGFGSRPGPDAYAALLATAIGLHEKQIAEEELNFFASAARGRPSLQARQRRSIELRYRDETYEFAVATLEPGVFRIQIDGRSLDVRLEHDGPYESRLCYDTPDGVRRHRIVSVACGLEHLVEVDGLAYRISRDPGGLLRAPAPGLVLLVNATEGQEVKCGDRLLALEAMKMEMPVVAPFSGRVRKILVRQSVQVAAGDPLVVIEPEEEAGEKNSAGERVVFPIAGAEAFPITQGVEATSENLGVEGPRAPPLDSRLASLANARGERNESVELEKRRTVFRTTVRELRRLMLGFDIGKEQVDALLSRWSASFPSEPEAPAAAEPDTVQAVPQGFEAVQNLLTVYADLEALFSKQRLESPGPTRLSNESWLHIYLREFRAEGKGMPEPFLAVLRAALAHYGVGTLADGPRLREALAWIYRSHLNVAQKNRVVIAALQQLLDHRGWHGAARTDAFGALLDRLVALTQEAYPVVSEAVQQARYALFTGHEQRIRREKALRRVDVALDNLSANPETPERPALMAELVSTPFALVNHLAPRVVDCDDEKRLAILEVLIRRFHRAHPLGERCVLDVDGRRHLLLRRADRADQATIVVGYVAAEQLEKALASLHRITAQLPAGARAQIDIFVGSDAEKNPDAKLLASALAAAGHADPRIERISFVLANRSPTVGFYTILPRDERWEEDRMLRGFHPAIGERLELWRMRNFHVERVSRDEDLYLFYARARQNEKDERFFVVAEVRALHPVRDSSGRLVALPAFEHALLQAFDAIREQQLKRDARRRLHWNRVTVFLVPPLLARREEVLEIVRRLHPSARHLGIEKIAVRAFLHEEPSQVPRDSVLSLSDRTGHRLEITVSEPHSEPLRALDDYSLKLVRARQRGTTYVYEIVKMLAPAEASAGFPAGEFEEYDLGSNGRADQLVSVKGRPFGQNSANVVVGVIRNFTAKHPEGMTRVLLLGDATRDMGALAEPECRRIIAAIDLAERLGVPLEWFPISSGAKIAMDSGTENLDWTAAVLRRIVELTQRGGEINVVVDGINVGAQSYWNAEATMLMHCRGCLIMTPRGAMLLTGKRALDYSGGVSAEDNLGIGGFERVMGVNGQAQYHARDLDEACRILMRYYEHTYRAPGEPMPRPRPTADPARRDVCLERCAAGEGFERIGDIWSDEKNPGRKKPFDVRTLMRAVIDRDAEPLERWASLRDGEVAVVWDAHLGGWPVSVIGVESRPLARIGHVPSDGPESWSGGTLFPLGSKKVARAINAASGNRPVVVLANLSGFDGSPESLRRLQLEYGAEIGRAVVNFQGPLVFCVIARYHGGAYVVFSKQLNPSMKVLALRGSYASVIGGAPAAAVVFPEEARALTVKDPRVVEMEQRLRAEGNGPQLQQEYQDVFSRVHAEKVREIAERFDSIHSVDRAQRVGSLDAIIEPAALRPALIEAIEAALPEAVVGSLALQLERRAG